MDMKEAFRWRAGYGPQLIYCCVLFASFSLALALGQAWLFLLICVGGLGILFIASTRWGQIRSMIGPDSDYFRGMLLIASGKSAEALEFVQEYRLRAPDDPLALELAGTALDALHRGEEALAEADRAVRTKKRWQGLMIRGGILLRLGLSAEALRDLEESYKIGGSLFTRMFIGTALLSLRRLDAAAPLLHRSQRVVKYSFVSVAAGDCQRLLGNHRSAADAYQGAVGRARREIAAGMPHQSILAYCLAQLGQEGEALDVAGEALERQPGDVLALATQALVNVRRGDPGGAQDKLRKMLPIAPQFVASALTDPQFTHLLAEKRFRELLAWALGAQRQTHDRARSRFPHLFA